RRHTRSYGDWSSDVCSSDLPAFATRVTGAVSFAPSNRMAEQRSLQKELFHQKQSTDRRKADEPVEAGDSKRKPARSNTRPLCARSEERRVGKECRARRRKDA